MKVRESITAVVGALGAALLAQYALYGILMGAVPLLSGSAWFADHIDTLRSATLILGFIATAATAGFTLGKLIPDKPIPHVLAVGVASPLLGYALAGPTALARGWQIPMYAAQLCVIGMIAIRVHSRRQRNHSGVHGAV